MSETDAQDRGIDPDSAAPARPDSAGAPVGGLDSGREDPVRLRHLARLGALFAGFAHEIKNPLSTIGLNLQLVQEEIADSAEPRDQRMSRRLGVVESEVHRLHGILEEFLGYVRVPKLAHSPIEPDPFVVTTCEFLEPELLRKGVSLRVLSNAGPEPIRVDAEKIRAVLVNLLRNALDACEPGDEIFVQSRRVESKGRDVWRIIVADTGSGMDEATVGRVFDPWFSTKKKGTGLGLPTARLSIEQHGGRITVGSEPGRGTQFTIDLPYDPKDPDTAPSEDPA